MVVPFLCFAGCVRGLDVLLNAQVPDGSAGVVTYNFGVNEGVSWQEKMPCFADGQCSISIEPYSGIPHVDSAIVSGSVDFGAGVVSETLADISDPNDFVPEDDEPKGSTTIDIPKAGLLTVELDLE